MARLVVDITPVGTWIALGVPGPSTLTIHRQDRNGRLLFNTTNVEPGASDNALEKGRNNVGRHVFNTGVLDQVYCLATDGLSWQVAFDQ